MSATAVMTAGVAVEDVAGVKALDERRAAARWGLCGRSLSRLPAEAVGRIRCGRKVLYVVTRLDAFFEAKLANETAA